MRARRLILCAAAIGLLIACSDEQQSSNSQELALTEQQQVHQGDPTTTTPTPAAGPEERLGQFFEVLNSDQPEQAVALVAQTPLQESEAELRQSLQQWAQASGAEQEIKIIDSQQAGDFALVRAQLAAPGADSAAAATRPVILYKEEGEWRVVWSLLGLEPERAAEINPQIADRLEPLYDWYSQQQRTEVSESAGAAPNS